MHLTLKPAPLPVDRPGFWRNLAHRLVRAMPRDIRHDMRAGLLAGDQELLAILRDTGELILGILAEGMECPCCRAELRLCCVALTVSEPARRAFREAVLERLTRKRRSRR